MDAAGDRRLRISTDNEINGNDKAAALSIGERQSVEPFQAASLTQLPMRRLTMVPSSQSRDSGWRFDRNMLEGV
jgi:hypothetical protein